MSAGNISIIKGDDVTLSFTFTKDDASAYDLTGGTVFLTVKKKLTDADADAVLSKTWSTHTNAAGGLTSVSLTNADTEALDSRNYQYDLQIKDSGGAIQSSGVGSFAVSPEVTVRTS